VVDSVRTEAELLALFADGQAPGSITPQDVRDFIVSIYAETGSAVLPPSNLIDTEDETFFYWGWENINGSWAVRRTARSDAEYWDATILENPTFPQLADAWPNRASLFFV
jgi:hypothetical protein